MSRRSGSIQTFPKPGVCSHPFATKLETVEQAAGSAPAQPSVRGKQMFWCPDCDASFWVAIDSPGESAPAPPPPFLPLLDDFNRADGPVVEPYGVWAGENAPAQYDSLLRIVGGVLVDTKFGVENYHTGVLPMPGESAERSLALQFLGPAPTGYHDFYLDLQDSPLGIVGPTNNQVQIGLWTDGGESPWNWYVTRSATGAYDYEEAVGPAPEPGDYIALSTDGSVANAWLVRDNEPTKVLEVSGAGPITGDDASGTVWQLANNGGVRYDNLRGGVGVSL